MKKYLLFIFSDGCEPLLNEISEKTIFDDFDDAFMALTNWVSQEWPMLEIPTPKAPGPYNLSHKGDHFQIWEVKSPQSDSPWMQ